MTIFLRVCMCAVLAALAVAARAAPPVPSDHDLGFVHDSRAEVLKAIRRVGILPPVVPAFSQRADLADTLVLKTADALRQAGFEVTGPVDFEAARQKLLRQVGGIYDPKTGAQDAARAQAVTTNARREYIEQDHLDALVALAVSPRLAAVRSDLVEWDGARERRDGGHPPRLIDQYFAGRTYYTGELSGFSLRLQLINSEGQVVYDRYGGIQLNAYYRPEGSPDGIEILFVPEESLFRDDRRIERAVRATVMPLLHSPQEIAAGANDPAINTLLINDLPPAPDGGERPSRSQPAGLPRGEVLARTHRVVVARPPPGWRSAIPEEAIQRYQRLIQEELAPLKWELTESARPVELVDAALRASQGLYDPMTGKLDTARLLELRKSALAQLDISPVPDAILWVGFERQTVAYHHGNAVWDGASQSALTLGPASHGLASQGQDGVVGALSLVVELRTLDDTLLYAGRGGVQLVQQVRGSKKVELAPVELFQDAARDRAAIHRALRELVLTP
jgi:hypothetical protein